MSKDARPIAPGLPHHIVARGRPGAAIFVSTEDYEDYLARLKTLAGQHGLRVWAYCVLPDHVHLIVVPETADSLGRVMRELQGKYLRKRNGKYRDRKRHWEEGYGSALIEEQLAEAVRYVERNPVRAGRVKRTEEYPWSSAAGHCGVREDAILDPAMPLIGKVPDWSLWLWSKENEAVAEGLRERTARPSRGRKATASLPK
jgi:putative transposase